MRALRLLAGLAFFTAALSGADARSGQPRLHPVETFTVVYAQTGTGAGTMTLHSREYGYRRAEIVDVVLKIGAVRMPMKQRNVIVGEQAITIDDAGGDVERTLDPSYTKLVEAMSAATSGDRVATLMKVGWEASPTGKQQTHAGEVCDEYASADRKQIYCATKDGILLYMDQGTAQTRFVRTATAVRRNDGGSDAAFALPPGALSAGPATE